MRNTGGGGTGGTAPSNLAYAVTAINAAVEFPITPDSPSVVGSCNELFHNPFIAFGHGA